MMDFGERTHGRNSDAALGLIGDRRGTEWEDNLLLEVIALEQLDIVANLLREQGLEALDCSRNGEKLLEELNLLGCSIFGGSWGRGSAGGTGLRKGVNGNGHKASGDELSDGNHDY